MIKKLYKNIFEGNNILDLEIQLAKEESINKQFTLGTLEYKLRKKYKDYTLTQFLNETAK